MLYDARNITSLCREYGSEGTSSLLSAAFFKSPDAPLFAPLRKLHHTKAVALCFLLLTISTTEHHQHTRDYGLNICPSNENYSGTAGHLGFNSDIQAKGMREDHHAPVTGP